jgi:hypothetical protein
LIRSGGSLYFYLNATMLADATPLAVAGRTGMGYHDGHVRRLRICYVSPLRVRVYIFFRRNRHFHTLAIPVIKKPAKVLTSKAAYIMIA